MRIKKRTLNEYRQTKDSIYKAPQAETNISNHTVLERYISYMKSENRMSQASIKNFLMYLEKNDLRITKG